MNQTFPMTTQGHAALKDELKDLKGVQRPSIVAQIAEARAHGDLSENAEYHAAKERQGFIEGRIKELEVKLQSANVVDPSSLSGDKVLFGAHVTIVDADTEEESTYYIVGDDEADAKKGFISVSSPVARALIGKSVGDDIEIKVPGRVKDIEILAVEYK